MTPQRHAPQAQARGCAPQRPLPTTARSKLNGQFVVRQKLAGFCAGQGVSACEARDVIEERAFYTISTRSYII
jgi:hypothetical protein